MSQTVTNFLKLYPILARVIRLNGLGVWYSLWVRVVPVSNPGWALILSYFMQQVESQCPGGIDCFLRLLVPCMMLRTPLSYLLISISFMTASSLVKKKVHLARPYRWCSINRVNKYGFLLVSVLIRVDKLLDQFLTVDIVMWNNK